MQIIFLSFVLLGAYIQYLQFAGKSHTSKVLNERQFSGNLLIMLKELDYFIKYTIQKQRPVSSNFNTFKSSML